MAGIELATASEPPAPAADLGASPFGRRPQPPLRCDLRLNHAGVGWVERSEPTEWHSLASGGLHPPYENWDDATPMVFWFWTRPAIIATPWCSRWRLSRASCWHADKHEGDIPHCSAKLHVFARCPEEVRLSAPQQEHELLELLRLA